MSLKHCPYNYKGNCFGVSLKHVQITCGMENVLLQSVKNEWCGGCRVGKC